MSSFKIVLQQLAAGEIAVVQKRYVMRRINCSMCCSKKDIHVFLSCTVDGH